MTSSVPHQLITQVVRPAVAAGRNVVVLFEEWQTAPSCERLDALLRAEGLRDSCILLWNANNHFGFDEIDWPSLARAASITTVSKYMKHLMRSQHVDVAVVPNGISEAALRPVDKAMVRRIRNAANTQCFAFKIGRFSADKRWHQALDAIAQLRADGVPARMLIRGGNQGFGLVVRKHATSLGLEISDWRDPIFGGADIAAAMAESDSPVVNLASFLPDAVIPEIYVAATAVLANSVHEPFGLVGLEAMAAGAVAVVGSTGEEYARPYANAIVIETDDGAEVASALRGLVERPSLANRLRVAARRDAADFVWPKVIEGWLERLRFLAAKQGVNVTPVTPASEPWSVRG